MKLNYCKSKLIKYSVIQILNLQKKYVKSSLVMIVNNQLENWKIC